MMHVLTFEGRAFPYANYEEKDALRTQIATVDPPKRAASPLLHTAEIARRVCMSIGKDVSGNVAGVKQILRVRGDDLRRTQLAVSPRTW